MSSAFIWIGLLLTIGTSWMSLQAQTNERSPLAYAMLGRPSLDKLQANKDVLWIGEITVDYYPDYDKQIGSNPKEKSTNYIRDYQNDSRWLKMVAQDDKSFGIQGDKLSSHLWDALLHSNMGLHPTELQERLYLRDEQEKMARIKDVSIEFDPETYGEVVRETIRKPEDAYQALRIKQLVYYDQHRMVFDVVLLGIAPLIIRMSSTGEVEEIVEAYWTTPTQLGTRPSLDDVAIIWAKRLYKHLDLSKAKVLKETKPLGDVFVQSLRDMEQAAENIYISSDWESKQRLEGYDWGVFDPGTDKERLVRAKPYLNPKNIKELVLVQDFYWDRSSNYLGIFQLGFGYFSYNDNPKEGLVHFIRKPYLDKKE